MALQDEVAAFLEWRITREGVPPVPLGTPEAVHRVEETRIGAAAQAVRVYTPESATPRPIVVYFHGGGWVTGDLEMHDNTCRRIANAGPCVVVNAGYRLAPEYPFPVPMQDCYDALVWVAANAAAFGGDPSKLAVAGSSAGGNLAACVALRARDEGGPALGLQVLLYPVLDSTLSSASYTENADAPVLTRDQMSNFWDQYLARDEDRVNPYASPRHAATLAGLPPSVVVTTELDPLRDEGESYAERLRADGVATMGLRYADQVHGFLAVNGNFRDSRDVVARVGQVVRTVFDDPPSLEDPEWSRTEVLGGA